MLLPSGALFVLVAPSGAGKSTWAARHLAQAGIVSSDELRGVVGVDPHDQRASGDAFEVLDKIVAARCSRGLTTVVDSTGLQAERRSAYRAIAARAGVPCHAIVFDVPQAESNARNKARARPVPGKVITGQWSQFIAAREAIDGEGFAAVHVVLDLQAPTRIVGQDVAAATATVWAPGESDAPRVHLHLGRFALGRTEPDPRLGLAAIARTAEEVGFDGIWLMDHLLQVPQVGRAWDDLPETWSTLAWLAAQTSSVRLGSLVTPVTFRPLALLAKAVATVDVLSGGRVTCGLGTGWFAGEHTNLGIELPSLDVRYARLEDHLRGLPLLWGAGTPAFEGRTVSLPKATSYPRPSQERVPLLVGGNGPRRTLRLAAEHADAVNLQGTPEAIASAVRTLRTHLDTLGRDRSEVRVTARVSAMTRASSTALDAAIKELAPSGVSPDVWAASSGAATVADQIARLRGLGALGVQDVMLSVTDATVDGVAQFAPVVDSMHG